LWGFGEKGEVVDSTKKREEGKSGERSAPVEPKLEKSAPTRSSPTHKERGGTHQKRNRI